MSRALMLIVGLGLAAISAPAVAAPCDADVVGLWRLVHVEAAEAGVEDLYAVAPYEFTLIRPDGTMIYLATNQALTDRAEIERRLANADRADGVTYQVAAAPPNILVIMRDGQPFQAFQCDLAERDQGDVRIGDMVMTNVDGAPHLRRIERRIS